MAVQKRRSRKDLIEAVLRSIAEGYNKPTKIMYGANLSWIALQDILGELERKEVVVFTMDGERRKVYSLTKEGREALEHLNEYQSVTKIVPESPALLFDRAPRRPSWPP